MGKKFIIEIEEVPYEQRHPDIFTMEGRMVNPRSADQLFRAVGFTSLVFTKEDLDKLTPLPDGYEMEAKIRRFSAKSLEEYAEYSYEIIKQGEELELQKINEMAEYFSRKKIQEGPENAGND